jgi:hypothetical protein
MAPLYLILIKCNWSTVKVRAVLTEQRILNEHRRCYHIIEWRYSHETSMTGIQTGLLKLGPLYLLAFADLETDECPLCWLCTARASIMVLSVMSG